MQTNRVNNSNIEKYQNVNNLSGSRSGDKSFNQTFLKDLGEKGVVFERSSEKKKDIVKKEPVGQTKRTTSDFQVNRATSTTKQSQTKNESVIDATSDVFDKFAKGLEKFVNAVIGFFTGIIMAFIPAQDTQTMPEQKEENSELKEEDLQEAVEEINNILYEKSDLELENEGVEDLGYVNTLDDDDEDYDPGYTEEDIARYLKEGDFDAITRVVTANGRKKSAHSTSLSTVYDRRGLTERMQVDARDEARLKGEQTREKFIKRI